MLVVCGHTHIQFDRMVGPVRVVNAGSAGMPFGAPGADWLLLGPDVQLRHTDYDLERAAAELAQARGLSRDGRNSSLTRLKAAGHFGVPKIQALVEVNFFAGLRKAGLPEE